MVQSVSTLSTGKKRLGYIDIAKGVAIICIIAGHFGIVTVNHFVYTFHVPLFFLISGYFFSSRLDLRSFAKQKFRQLLVPYYVTGIAIILATMIVQLLLDTPLSEVCILAKDIFIALLYGSGTPVTSPFQVRQIGLLWFLLALFWSFIIVRIFIEMKHPFTCIFCVALFAWITSQYVWLPFSIQAGCMAALYIYLGYVARQIDLFSLKPSPFLLVFLLALWAFCIWNGFGINIVNGTITGWGLGAIDAIGASYLVILACRWAEQRLRTMARCFNYLGQTTLVMMCFHAISDYAFPNYLLYGFLEGQMAFSHPLSNVIVVGLNIAWAVMGVYISFRVSFLRKLFSMREIVPLQPVLIKGIDG